MAEVERQEEQAPEEPRPPPDAYPVAAAPPWRRRRVAVGVPAIILVAGGFAVALGARTWGSGGRGGPGHAQGDELDPVDRALSEIHGGDLEPEDASPPDASASEDEEDEGAAGDLVSLVQPGEPEPDPSAVVVHEGRVGSGYTVAKRLMNHGLSAREAHAVLTALSGLYDFRSSLPTHTYRLELARQDRSVVRFRYQAGPTQVYQVVPGELEYEGRRIDVPTTVERVRVGLRVRGTLAESIARSGLKQQVLSTFLRAFDRDVGFQNAQREGDTFKVIAEQETLGRRFIGYRRIWAMEYAGERVGTRAFFYFQGGDEEGGFYDEDGFSTDRTQLRTPLSYSRITSPFDPGRLHPILGRRVPHNGVDFAAPRGTPVWACSDGTVAFVGRKGAAGNLVVLSHDGDLESVYAHLEKFRGRLKRGDEVRSGYVIGYVGSTGRSTGPHLHYGIRKAGRFVDPLKLKSIPGPPIDRRYRNEFRDHARKLSRELRATAVRSQ